MGKSYLRVESLKLGVAVLAGPLLGLDGSVGKQTGHAHLHLVKLHAVRARALTVTPSSFFSSWYRLKAR